MNRFFVKPRMGGFVKLASLAVAFSYLVPIQSASAAEAAVTKLDAVTATVTSTPVISPNTYLVGSSVTVDVNVDFHTDYANDDDTTIKGKLTSGSGGTLTATATGSITQSGDSCSLSAPATNSIFVNCLTGVGNKLTNTFKVGTYTFVPTTTGSHTLTFWHDFNGNNSLDVGEKSTTATFNVVTDVEVSKESVNTISLATNSSTVSVDNPVSVNWGADTSAFTVAADQRGKFTVKGVLSKPGGAVSTLTASDIASGTDSIPTGADASTETASGITYSAVSVAAGDDLLGNDVLATTSAGFGNFTFTPDVKGVYELTVWHDFDGDGSADLDETLQKLTITVVSQALANEIQDITATETSSDPYYVGSSVTFDVYVEFATGYDNGDDTTIKGKLTSGSGGTLSASAAGDSLTDGGDTCSLSSATVVISVLCDKDNGTDFGATPGSSSKVGTYTFVPTTTGSHTLTFWHDADNSGIDNGAEQKVEVIFEVLEGAPDLTSPTILSAATSEDGLSIRVSTDELLECPAGNCSPDKMNWSISVDGGEAFNPFEVALDSEDLTVIILTLSEAIPSCVSVSLTFDSTGTKFRDSSNNALNSATDFLVSNLVPGECGGDGDGDGDGEGDGDGSPDPELERLIMRLERAANRETLRAVSSLERGARTIMATLGSASAVDEKQLKDAGMSTMTALGTSLALEYINKNRAKMQSMSDILATIQKTEFMVQVLLLKSNENVRGLDLAKLGLVSETYKKKYQLLKQLLLLPVESIDTLEELEAVISELTKGNK